MASLGWQRWWDEVRQRLMYVAALPQVGEGLRYYIGRLTAHRNVYDFFPISASGLLPALVAAEGRGNYWGWYFVVEGPQGKAMCFATVPPLAHSDQVYGQERVPVPQRRRWTSMEERQRAFNEFGESNLRRAGALASALEFTLDRGATYVEMLVPQSRERQLYGTFLPQFPEKFAAHIGATWVGEIPLEELPSLVVGEAEVPGGGEGSNEPPASGEQPPAGGGEPPSSRQPPASGEQPPAGGSEPPSSRQPPYIPYRGQPPSTPVGQTLPQYLPYILGATGLVILVLLLRR